MKKLNNIPKNVFCAFFFSLLGTKTPKCMQNTFYRKTNRHYSNFPFQCFSAVYAQNAKNEWKTIYIGIQNKITKNLSFELF